MAVKKAGRTTDLTFGTVDAIGVTVNVGYSSGTARFVDQIIIAPAGFSAPGDSGSLIVTNDQSCPNPVALLFAGSETFTIANPIQKVYDAFKVEPVGCSPAAAVEAERMERDVVVAGALEAKGRNEEELLNIPGVVGVGVGRENGEVVVKVFVEKMTDELKLVLPNFIDGHRISPKVTGKFIAY
jgi:hypothetical protein